PGPRRAVRAHRPRLRAAHDGVRVGEAALPPDQPRRWPGAGGLRRAAADASRALDLEPHPRRDGLAPPHLAGAQLTSQTLAGSSRLKFSKNTNSTKRKTGVPMSHAGQKRQRRPSCHVPKPPRATSTPHWIAGVRAVVSPDRPASFGAVVVVVVAPVAVAGVVGVSTGIGSAGLARPTSLATTMSRCDALYFGVQVVRVRRASSVWSSTWSSPGFTDF